jgi:FAD/FMN-containing dehydrogenase/Fe-S oxidoreductase
MSWLVQIGEEHFDRDSAARELADALRNRIAGEVRFDASSRALYATDASNYRQVPIGVVVPRAVEDVIATIATCRQFDAPVLSRGGGTSLAGQCCNAAVVIDWSKYLNQVLEIDPRLRLARVQPGTIHDDVSRAARPFDLDFGPDPATHDHCTIGGMLGNDSCGVHSQMAGRTTENTESLEVLTYDGVRMHLGWMNQSELDEATHRSGREGRIYAGIKRLGDRYADLVRRRYPKIPRRVSGYNLDELLPDHEGRFNLARALVGSEGTLVTILEATINLVRRPRERVLVVLGYPDIFKAADHLESVLSSKPIGLEAIDDFLVQNLKKKNLQTKSLSLLPEGKGWLLVEFGGEILAEAEDQAHAMMSRIRRERSAPAMKLYDDPHQEHEVWLARESGLGATAFVPGEAKTWEGWEDSAVPPERMGAYLRELCALYEKHGYRGSMYGHFGQGCLHTRINFDLESERGIHNFRHFLDEATDLVVKHGGSISGEHGDGQSKAEFLHKMFGPELIEAFREFKSIWDPERKMNPGKLVDPYRIDENLRLGADYKQRTWQPATHFHYPDDEGSLVHAAERCVGVGKCRRLTTGNEVMCPSFIVTREEKHSTRGRAHLLWEMTQRNPLQAGWRSEAIKEALDLCLACKGCKGDCPVNVDVATLKAEFLAHYYDGRVRPRHAYAFGFIDRWAHIASFWPGMANLFSQTYGLSAAAKIAAGMSRRRKIPAFAPRTFQSWFRSTHRQTERAQGRRIVLWPDTFNNYFLPETAKAAVDFLRASGFNIEIPQQHVCCGRPLYDYGFLDQAKKYLERTLLQLAPYLDGHTAIVFLEPSCASIFRDELLNLLPDDPRAQHMASQSMLFSEFIEREQLPLPQIERRAIVQGHCHHKSLIKFEQEEKVLRRMGLDLEVLDSGCCGMAGAFGYEDDKYEIAQAIGERVLLPRVRKATATTLIIANGFSCREQIAQSTSRHALHLAEVIQLAKRHGISGPAPGSPEQISVEERMHLEKRERVIAGASLATALLGGLLLYRRFAR